MAVAAVMLASALTFSAGAVAVTITPVFAEQPQILKSNGGVRYTKSIIDYQKSGSITLFKYEENNGNMAEGNGLAQDVGQGRRPIKGVQFKALKVADIENLTGSDNGTNSVGTYYTNLSSVFTSLLSTYGIPLTGHTIQSNGKTTTGYTTKEIESALEALNKAEAPAADPANKELPGELAVAKAVNEHPTADLGYTDKDGRAAAGSLSLGLYLIAETDYKPNAPLEDANKKGQEDVTGDNTQNHQDIENASSPFLISVPMSNVTEITNEDGQTKVQAGTAWMYDLTVYPKNQTTTVTKKIIDPDPNDNLKLEDYEDYMIGDTIKQVIYADAPVNLHLDDTAANGGEGRADYDARNYTKYAISDTLTKGLAFDGVTKVVYGAKVDAKREPDFNQMDVMTPGADYKVITTPVDIDKLDGTAVQPDAGQQFTVELTQAGLDKLNALHVQSQVVVYFDTQVTPEANIGPEGNETNTNQATLTWKHTNSQTYTKKSNKTHLFSYELDITKKAHDTEDTFDPANSVFTVRYNLADGKGYAAKNDFFKYNKGAENDTQILKDMADLSKKPGQNLVTEDDQSTAWDDTSLVKFVKETDGVYHVYSAKLDKENPDPRVSPAHDGKLILKGLDAVRYTVTERETQDHFSLMKSGFDVDFSAAKTADQTHITGDLASAVAITGDERADQTIGKNGTKFVDDPNTITKLNLATQSGKAFVTIMNDKVITLRTGGNGIEKFWIIALIAGAATASGAAAKKLTRKKAKTDSEE